jgi:hypothetical protein
MIGRVHLAHRAETLTRWTTHNHIDSVGTYKRCKLARLVGAQVLFQCVLNIRKICPENLHCLRIEIYRGHAAKSGLGEAKTEPAAPTEQVNECK